MSLPRNVVLLGLVSLLNDAASEIVAPLMPTFLTVTLGAAPAMVGILEGTADTVSSLVKLVGGRISDRVGRRKPLVVAGYAIAAATRPLLAFAPTAAAVLGLRVVDRVGKGLRTSPRDALLAESALPGQRGAVFGFHRAMDHAGAFLGAFIAWALLSGVTQDLRAIFLWSALPAAIGVAVVALGVRDTRHAPEPAAGPILAPLPRELRPALVAIGLSALGTAADGFLLLRAGDAGVPLAALPLLWMGLHVVKVVASLWAGPLADRVGRRRVIAMGWGSRALLYGGFALATTPVGVAAAFVAYGLHHGLSEGAEKALVADLAGERAGTAFGWYNLVSGVVALPAGAIFGALWTWGSPEAAFAWGAALAVVGVGVLAAFSAVAGPPPPPR